MYFPQDQLYIDHRDRIYNDIIESLNNGRLPNDITIEDRIPIEEGYPYYTQLSVGLPGNQHARIFFSTRRSCPNTNIIVADAMVILDDIPILRTNTTVFNHDNVCDLITRWTTRARSNQFHNRT